LISVVPSYPSSSQARSFLRLADNGTLFSPSVLSLSHPATLIQSQDLDQKIQDVYRHIQTERKILEASQLLRQATTNQDVLRKNEVKIRETERSLSYFEDTLRELQALKLQQDPVRSGGSPSPQVKNSLFSSYMRPSDTQPAG
jgi:hypothetical protein